MAYKITTRLVTGHYLNVAFKLIGNSMYGIKAIKTAYDLPEKFYPHSFNKISRPDSDIPMFVWGDRKTKTIYIYTEAERIMLPPNCEDMCKGFFDLEDVSAFFDPRMDDSWVTSVKGAFDGCSKVMFLPKWYEKAKKKEDCRNGLDESYSDRVCDFARIK